MSAPIFSINPDDYPNVVSTINDAKLTPVIIVIAGSHATNMITEKSDFDVWGVYLEDEPEEINVPIDDRASLLGHGGWTQMVLNSLAYVRMQLENPVNDPAKKVWWREDFLAYPRLYDSVHADEFRKELSEVPVGTVAERYLEAGDWHVTFVDAPKMQLRAIRLYLTGARLLELSELVVDNQVLVAWAGNPSIEVARKRLQDEIDKLT